MTAPPARRSPALPTPTVGERSAASASAAPVVAVAVSDDPVVLPSEGWDQFRAMVEEASDVVQIIEADGTTRYINALAGEVLGVPADRLVGRHVLTAIHPDDHATVQASLARILQAPPSATVEVEVRVVHPGGAVRWVHGRLANRMQTPGLAAVVSTWRDVTVSHDLRAHLRHAATHDPLTNLANRSLFIDHLSLALAAIERHADQVAAVMLCDLDHFKRVNDGFGHSVGDELLRQVGQRLAGAVRPHDTVGRMGGDEFAILCPDLTDPTEVEHIAERVQGAVSGSYELVFDGPAVFVGASVGVTLSRPDATEEDLLREADTALYEAKRRGRNHVELYGPPLRDTLSSRATLKADLRHGIGAGELELHYQPKVDLVSGHTNAVEALVRWRHPTRGLLHPADFLEVAQESGLLVPLGEWVLGEAIQQAARWQEEGRDVGVSVNVSADELGRPDFVAALATLLAARGLDADRLCLEVTESAALLDLEATAGALRSVRDLGAHVSLDDFGTGYSSLTWLQRLPVDSLKLDRTFIERLVDHPPTAAIVGALLGLAHALDLRTVGEGVETPEQLRRLAELGCDEAQGNLIGEPVPADLVPPLLR